MTSTIKLGGFKVLKDVDFFSIGMHLKPKKNPARFCRLLARKEINLSYLTCLKNGQDWGLNFVADKGCSQDILNIIEENSGKIIRQVPDTAILSIFPHSRNPEIAGRLFVSFGNQGLIPSGIGTSSSAVSIVLKKESLDIARDALFKTFSFSSYRTPEDWTLAQKGREELYKEVVANYREAMPKVYGVEYHDLQQLIKIESKKDTIKSIGKSLIDFAGLGQKLTFSANGPGSAEGHDILTFCLPLSDEHSAGDILKKTVRDTKIDIISPVSIFAMNGPHFGDRYGISSRFLTAFQSSKVDVLGLSCTIASLTIVVNSEQKDLALSTIQKCFKVPSIIKRD
ncbi:hypothetical protein ACFLZT_06010 [Thermodesulfobacteriota bacterium]